MASTRLVVMVETAIMAALAYVFNFIKFNVFWANGGSISLIMIPIIILTFRRGVIPGVVAGLLVGGLKIMLGGTTIHPVQIILDYPLPYAVLGLAGLVSLTVNRPFWKNAVLVTIGVLFAASLRFLCHFTSGVVWFGKYAPEGMPVPLFSFIYNISYVLPEAIISIILILLLLKARPQLFGARMS